MQGHRTSGGGGDATPEEVLEGLEVIRDGIRVGLKLMPAGCDAARVFRPLLRDLEHELVVRARLRADA